MDLLVVALVMVLCFIELLVQLAAVPIRPELLKGKKMPGRMGNDTVLRKNVVVVDIRPEENVVLLKGPLPGAKNGLLKIFRK